MTYIPAEQGPTRGRFDDPRDPRRRRGAQQPAVDTPGAQSVSDPHLAPWQSLQGSAPEQNRTTAIYTPQRFADLAAPPPSASWEPTRVAGPPQQLPLQHRHHPGQSVYQYGGRSPDRRRDVSVGIVAGQLVRAALVFGIAALLAWSALRTVSGQWADEMALQQGAALHDRLPVAVTDLLGSLTLLIGIGGAALALLLALAHRRWIPLLVALLSAGAALACVQLLKHGLLTKSPYGIQESAQNSLPSGHTAAAAAAVAVVLMVAPTRWRKPLALLGALAVTAAGLGTVVNGWHRPSDVVVAILVVTGWFVLGSVVLRLLVPAEPWVPQRGLTLAVLTVLGTIMTVFATMTLTTLPVTGLALAAGAVATLTVTLFACHQLVRSLRPRRR